LARPPLLRLHEIVVAGIVTLIRGGVLAGIVMIIVGLLIGPGG
jgi:hypothetical protein